MNSLKHCVLSRGGAFLQVGRVEGAMSSSCAPDGSRGSVKCQVRQEACGPCRSNKLHSFKRDGETLDLVSTDCEWYRIYCCFALQGPCFQLELSILSICTLTCLHLAAADQPSKRSRAQGEGDDDGFGSTGVPFFCYQPLPDFPSWRSRIISSANQALAV